MYLTVVPYGKGGGRGRLVEPGNVGENVLHAGGITGSGQQGWQGLVGGDPVGIGGVVPEDWGVWGHAWSGSWIYSEGPHI